MASEVVNSVITDTVEHSVATAECDVIVPLEGNEG